MGEVLARFIIADSSIELVPPIIWNHPDVKRASQRYGIPPSRMLLEKSLHYRAMGRLESKWKRGRPDILHVTLLNILDSPLASKGLIDVYIHTIEGRVFRVDPRTRIPVSYERFRGLFSQLLLLGRVPPEGESLIWEVETDLRGLVRGEPVVIMWEKGRKMSVFELAELIRRELRGAFIVIGGFPRGDFSSEILGLRGALKASIYGGLPLKAWSVASRILCGLENIIGYK